MSAFGSPWKDIDDTREGTPYIVDNDGWGEAVKYSVSMGMKPSR